MARDDDETPWTRQLLVAVGVLLAVALVIGGVVSAVALGAAKVSGIDDSSPTPTAKPSLYVPSGDPTTDVDPYPDPDGDSSDEASEGLGEGSSPSGTPTPKRAKHPIALHAAPLEVPASQPITLTGSYRRHPGVTLQVQRFQDGGWVDFPVTVTVTGGTFSTYITTGREGLNRLRVVDPAGTAASNAVRVVVR